VDPATPARNERRYLAVMTFENGKPGQAVQLQQSTFTRSSIDQ
jgi:hypothetical protein